MPALVIAVERDLRVDIAVFVYKRPKRHRIAQSSRIDRSIRFYGLNDHTGSWIDRPLA